MVEIEDQRYPITMLHHVACGIVFEHGSKYYLKVSDDIVFNFTDNTSETLDRYTEVKEIREAVLCLA